MKRAFTIIELLVVIAIIAILMGVLIGTFSGSSESARAAKCQANMHNLAMAVQAYGMGSGVYPRASTVERRISGSKKTETVHGWLGDLTDPYEKGEDKRKKCYDNGAIWDAMKHSRDSYVCPSHRRYAQEKSKPDPLWSYAMNGYYDMGKSAGGEYSGTVQRGYPGRRADRFLLFAELQFAKSGSDIDPVLNYNDGEEIGFCHKDGKHSVGHVCFADGHVEKLRAPKTGDAKNLTKWLCHPTDNQRGDFDISFDGKTYKQDFTQAAE